MMILKLPIHTKVTLLVLCQIWLLLCEWFEILLKPKIQIINIITTIYQQMTKISSL